MSEEMERKFFTDFLFVGAGPACLSGAIRLQNQIDDHNDALEAEGKEPLNTRIMVLEKGSDVGSHGISGAVLDPRALNELFPGWKEDDLPRRTICRT